jgi:single-stranded-DNA-specific exonuclease
MAAGFTIKNSKIADLKEHLENESQNIEPNLLVPVLKIDFEVDADVIELETLEEIKKLEPFGTGNPEPVFAMTGKKIFDVKTVGSEGKHLKFKVEGLSPYKPIDAIYFNGGERMKELIDKEKVDLAFNIKENNFNGRTTVNLHIKDFR